MFTPSMADFTTRHPPANSPLQTLTSTAPTSQNNRMHASQNRPGWLASLGNVYSRPRYPKRYPTEIMHPTAPRRPLLLLAVATALTVVGCEQPSKPLPQKTQDTPALATDGLPEWLTTGPSDWGDEAWLPYQATLIELRQPILRSGGYTERELEIVTAEVEHFPGEYEDRIKQEWLDKWQTRLVSYERTGGCGCCNEVYTVTGPRVAMHEFPNQRDYFPRFTDAEDGG